VSGDASVGEKSVPQAKVSVPAPSTRDKPQLALKRPPTKPALQKTAKPLHAHQAPKDTAKRHRDHLPRTYKSWRAEDYESSDITDEGERDSTRGHPDYVPVQPEKRAYYRDTDIDYVPIAPQTHPKAKPRHK